MSETLNFFDKDEIHLLQNYYPKLPIVIYLAPISLLRQVKRKIVLLSSLILRLILEVNS